MGYIARILNYEFNPGLQQIVFKDVQIVDISRIQYIINLTTGATMYDFSSPTPITTDGFNTVTVSTSTAGMVYTNELAITYDFEIAGAGGGGSVTFVGLSGGSTGMSYLGSPITSSGTIILMGTLNPTHGGTGLTTYSTGDILYTSAPDVLSKLPVSTNGKVLTLTAGLPAWESLPPSGVTGSGTLNTIAKFTPSGTAVGNSLLSEGTNTIEQRNSTNAQNFNLYNTYTDASNYERLQIHYAANVAYFGSAAAGSGTARSTYFGTFTGAGSAGIMTQGSARLIIGSTGNLALNTNQLFVQQSTGNVGIGTTSPTARLHTISTTEQQRTGYDASNYFSTTVGSTGGVTFNAVGAGSAFTFSDAVTTTSNFTAAAGGSYGLGLIRTSQVSGIADLGDWNGGIDGNYLRVDDGTGKAFYDNTAHDGVFGINTSTPSVALDVVGQANISEVVKLAATAFASLPASPLVGMLAHISDSDTDTWGDPISGGGSSTVIAFFNGTKWTVMGR